MILIAILTFVACALLGSELSYRVCGKVTAMTRLERISSAGVFALSVWIGSLWVLGLLSLLTRRVLIGRTLIVLLVGIVLWVIRKGNDPISERSGASRDFVPWIWLCAGLPLLLWVVFALWRGAVLPPVSHDVLAYHLPKAVLFARAHAYVYLPQLHVIARKLPSNYELLLADVIVVTGRDDLTEWLSTVSYILFVVSGTALVQRWWGVNATRDAIVALILAQMPVTLLHSSAHKNDLLLAFLVVSAIMWGARFTSTAEKPAAIMMILSTAMAVGTKPQAGFVAVALTPCVLWRLWRGTSRRTTLELIAMSILALSLLGGAAYAIDYANSGSAAGSESRGALTTFQFNDFANLWQAPYVLIAAPFSRHANSLFVPWQHQPWFWRRYEIYFSHVGVLMSLAMLIMPFALIYLRKPYSIERMVATLVALLAFVAMLPVVTVPHGLYTISLPRYSLFIAPVVLGWSAHVCFGARERLARPALVTASVLFVLYAVDTTIHDSFAPLRYAIWASRNPGTRLVPFTPNRAACVVDRIAGPHDKVAVDAGFSSWIHPAFGRELSRPVQLLTGAGPLRVDRDARWVAIDRGYSTAWENPAFRDLSQTAQYFGRGRLSAADRVLVREALALPGFRPVFVDERSAQVVLVRR